MNKGQEIKERCEKIKVSIKSILNESGVDKNTVYNWKKKEPKCFDEYEKIDNILKQKENEQKK